MKERETAFVGRITAGVTHEFLNVLAIISEASGLLDDILTLNRGELSSWDEKAMAALARIRRQIGRGTELSERLNSFAHSLDESTVRIEINDILDQVAFMMQRSSRLERVVLQIHHADPPPAIFGNPLHLQIVLTACIDRCLDLTEPGGTIALHAQEHDDVIAIRCEGAPQRVRAEERHEIGQRFAELDDVIGKSGMRIVHEGPRPLAGLALHIPQRC